MDEIRDKLDQMVQDHGQSKYFLRIQDYESKHTLWVLNEYGRFVSQFEHFFDILNDLIVAINYIPKDSWPAHRSIQFLLTANNVRFFYNSFDRLIKGFWVESMVVLRKNCQASPISRFPALKQQPFLSCIHDVSR
jgi:hypothetical protein